MKATIKLLQHKLAKFVKYQIADTKRGVDMAKAKKQIEIFHILEKHIGSFHGYINYSRSNNKELKREISLIFSNIFHLFLKKSFIFWKDKV